MSITRTDPAGLEAAAYLAYAGLALPRNPIVLATSDGPHSATTITWHGDPACHETEHVDSRALVQLSTQELATAATGLEDFAPTACDCTPLDPALAAWVESRRTLAGLIQALEYARYWVLSEEAHPPHPAWLGMLLLQRASYAGANRMTATEAADPVICEMVEEAIAALDEVCAHALLTPGPADPGPWSWVPGGAPEPGAPLRRVVAPVYRIELSGEGSLTPQHGKTLATAIGGYGLLGVGHRPGTPGWRGVEVALLVPDPVAAYLTGEGGALDLGPARPETDTAEDLLALAGELERVAATLAANGSGPQAQDRRNALAVLADPDGVLPIPA